MASTTTSGVTHSNQPAEITEDAVRKLLAGKQLFLRGGYLDNTLSFNEHGALIGHSPQGSYTLSAIEIDKVLVEAQSGAGGPALRAALSGCAALRGSHQSCGPGEHYSEKESGENHYRPRACGEAQTG